MSAGMIDVGSVVRFAIWVTGAYFVAVVALSTPKQYNVPS